MRLESTAGQRARRAAIVRGGHDGDRGPRGRDPPQRGRGADGRGLRAVITTFPVPGDPHFRTRATCSVLPDTGRGPGARLPQPGSSGREASGRCTVELATGSSSSTQAPEIRGLRTSRPRDRPDARRARGGDPPHAPLGAAPEIQHPSGDPGLPVDSQRQDDVRHPPACARRAHGLAPCTQPGSSASHAVHTAARAVHTHARARAGPVKPVHVTRHR